MICLLNEMDKIASTRLLISSFLTTKREDLIFSLADDADIKHFNEQLMIEIEDAGLSPYDRGYIIGYLTSKAGGLCYDQK